MLYELTDFQWQKLEKFLPKNSSGRKPKNLRKTFSGIKWIKKMVAHGVLYPNILATGTAFTDIFVAFKKKIFLKIF